MNEKALRQEMFETDWRCSTGLGESVPVPRLRGDSYAVKRKVYIARSRFSASGSACSCRSATI